MKCPTCDGSGSCVHNDGAMHQCATCKGDGIEPTPRVNCSGCGTPHPAHETARGMCVRCLGEEVTKLRKGLSLACENIGNGSAASENASVEFLTVDVPREIRLYCNSLRRELEIARGNGESLHVCRWREIQPGWAFCGCRALSRPIEKVVKFEFCPFCRERVEVVRENLPACAGDPAGGKPKA